MINVCFLLGILWTVPYATDSSMVVKFSADAPEMFGNFTDVEEPPECVELMNLYFSDYQEDKYKSVYDTVGSLCQDYQKIVACLHGTKRLKNQRLLIIIDFLQRSWDFFCSDTGKTVMSDYKQSPCFEEEEKLKTVGERVELCLNATEAPDATNKQALCDHMRSHQECVYDIYSDECGVPAAVIVRQLNLVVFKTLPVYRDCFPEYSGETDGPNSFQM